MKPILSNAMKEMIFEHNLAVTLSLNGINPPIEESSNVERFYEWIKKIKNIHIGSGEKMIEAFRKVALNK